jgi:CheY-like chemotaxis protein
MTLAETLEDAGYKVVSAENGDAACAMLKHANGFDVLLTDLQMPGERDGIAVAQKFQKCYPDRPVVFMTGRPDMLARVGKLSESERLLRKPFGSAQMLAALGTLLSQH